MSEAVLAIRLRALGDVILTTPALRALRRGHPDADLEVVTEARYAPVLEGLEGVRRVWALERGTSAARRLIQALRRVRYRWAVDFFGNPRSAAIAALSGARHTAGFALRVRRVAYHITVPRDHAPAPGRREYAAEAHLRLAAAAGGIRDGVETRIALGEAARAEAARLLERAAVDRPERTIGLVAAGTWSTKTWPLGHAAVLARCLIAAGHPVLLIFGPGEDAVAARLQALVPEARMLPRCGVAALAGVIANLRALIGTDSGPRHLAAALGRPTFTWFGPTHPDTWNPPGPLHAFWSTDLPCRACDRTHCPHWACLPGLAPQRAAELVLAHLVQVEDLI